MKLSGLSLTGEIEATPGLTLGDGRHAAEPVDGGLKGRLDPVEGNATDGNVACLGPRGDCGWRACVSSEPGGEKGPGTNR